MRNLFSRLILIGLMTLLLALAVGGQAAAQTEATPGATSTPSLPVTLQDDVTLENNHSSETIEDPKLSIEVDKPVLIGDPATVDAFNTAVDQIIEETAGSFKSDMLAAQDLPPEIADQGSYIKVSYQYFIPAENLLSIAFGIGWYGAGAAHPNSYSRTLNYDLDTGTVLELADLFKEDAPYLEVLSEYCVKALTEKGTLVFPDGAEPTEENYQNWNLTPDGILITFDDYQVAPHSAGPQYVLVPYEELADIIDPDGVLGPLVTRG